MYAQLVYYVVTLSPSPLGSGIAYNGANQPRTGTLPKSVSVKGQHIAFDINPTTFAVTNYTLTGYANDLRLVAQPTVVFASKEVTLTAAQRSGAKLVGNAPLCRSSTLSELTFEVSVLPVQGRH